MPFNVFQIEPPATVLSVEKEPDLVAIKGVVEVADVARGQNPPRASAVAQVDEPPGARPIEDPKTVFIAGRSHTIYLKTPPSGSQGPDIKDVVERPPSSQGMPVFDGVQPAPFPLFHGWTQAL